MNTELDIKLLEILNNTTKAIGNGVDFLSAEIPDVIYQLLLWYGIYNLILNIIAIIGFYVQYRVSKWWVVEVELKALEDSDFRWIGTVFGIGIGGFVLLIIWTHLLNLTWLKIWIAPKIWLIEYTASLVKGYVMSNNNELTYEEVHSPLRCSLEMERCILDIQARKLCEPIQQLAYEVQISLNKLITELEKAEQ